MTSIRILEIAKGIEKIYLDSHKSFKELIEEGKKLLEKRAECYEETPTDFQKTI